MLETCRHCGTNVFPNADRTCPQCGGNLDGAPAPQRIPNGKIAGSCPNCGETAHKKAKPDRLVAFVYDRVCEKCGTRYIPPTPAWAAIVFILIGLAMAGGVGLDVLIHIRQGEVILVLWKLIFVGVGLAAVIYGFRSLFQSRATR